MNLCVVSIPFLHIPSLAHCLVPLKAENFSCSHLFCSKSFLLLLAVPFPNPNKQSHPFTSTSALLHNAKKETHFWFVFWCSFSWKISDILSRCSYSLIDLCWPLGKVCLSWDGNLVAPMIFFFFKKSFWLGDSTTLYKFLNLLIYLLIKFACMFISIIIIFFFLIKVHFHKLTLSFLFVFFPFLFSSPVSLLVMVDWSLVIIAELWRRNETSTQLSRAWHAWD